MAILPVVLLIKIKTLANEKIATTQIFLSTNKHCHFDKRRVIVAGPLMNLEINNVVSILLYLLPNFLASLIKLMLYDTGLGQIRAIYCRMIS